jgi:ubiquinone/menaquinone biosynthesis C-methylase UbiE
MGKRGHVTATDISLKMLGLQKRARSLGLNEIMDFNQSDAKRRF